MPEAISKFEPQRTMQLRGFGGGHSVAEGYGCAASLHDASATGCTVSGVWGAQSDFCILELWNADNVYEHPRLRYLPDWAFDGVTLAFDLELSDCMLPDCTLYPNVDWATLNIEHRDGSISRVSLLANSTGPQGAQQATAQFTLEGSPGVNDYVELAWIGADGTMTHSNYLVGESDTLASIVAGLASFINGNSNAGILAAADGATITLTLAGATGSVGGNGNRYGIYGSTAAQGTSGPVPGTGSEAWSPSWQQFTEGSSPASWSLKFAFDSLKDTSGNAVTVTDIQSIYLTFAPAWQMGSARGEFSATISNLTVTDANGRCRLKVAGPGSLRLEEDDAWVVRSGYWEDPALVDPVVATYWSEGRAIRSAYNASEVRQLTIETHCAVPHDIYLGTWLDYNCGILSAALDGGTAVTLDCWNGAGAAGTGATVRRRLFAGVAAGQHSVVLTVGADKNADSQGWYFYFDFLECAVLSDVTAPEQTYSSVGVATDFDTDATYKMSPARLVWGIQGTGLLGEIDHYAGVFWWAHRKMGPATGTNAFGADWFQQTKVKFSGTPTFGGSVTLSLGATQVQKLNFYTDTAATIAVAFQLLINAQSSALQAALDPSDSSHTTLILTGAAAGADYHMAISVVCADSGGGVDANFSAAITTTNANPPAEQIWMVDDQTVPVLNRAAQDWHADFFKVLAAAGIGVTVSFSQELVDPPDAPANGEVWVQRFPDGTAAETATGFGTLNSSMCAPGAPMQTFMSKAYAMMASLMAAAGLPARLQFGEVLWWYIRGASGMACYDADTAAAAQRVLGRALHTFLTPNDDPSVSGYADANFLQARLGSYVAGLQAAITAALPGYSPPAPSATFELLWPLDVNDPATCKLLNYINLPGAWRARAGSGFDTFVCEGFSYAGVNLNLDEAQTCAGYPFMVLGWDRAHCRYLQGWYNPTWPWTREFQAAQRTGVPLIKFWAYDQLCLYGWPLPLPEAAPAPAFL